MQITGNLFVMVLGLVLLLLAGLNESAFPRESKIPFGVAGAVFLFSVLSD